MDLLQALAVATDEFSRRLAVVGDAEWSRPTPCTEWDVRYLVAHVVGGNRFAASLLSGRSADDAMAEVMSTPQLSDDALSDFSSTAASQLEAFGVANASRQRIDHPLGDISVEEFLEFRVFDLTIHTWDLAHALGVDEALAPELIETVTAIVLRGRPGMGFGIGALSVAEAGSSPLAQLLALSGRRAT